MALDKKLHFAAGFIISVGVGYVLHEPLYGLSAAAVAGVLKELRDWCVYRGFDEKDMVVTWLGGFVGFIVTMLLKS